MQTNDSFDQSDDFEQHLEELLADAEQTAHELRAELRELRSIRKKGSEALQRAEVERLEHHLAQTRVDWRKVREYFVLAVREVRSKRES